MAVTWIGGGGAVIGTGTLLVAGGVVIGVAAVAYLGYRAWIYYSEQSRIKAAAKAAGIADWRELGDAIEAFKQKVGFRGELTWQQILEIAWEVKAGLWKGTK